ncbi:MAG TPA: hypothetical protein VFQ39_06445 [Longimicrobium sp.]|nr:hypothetical protein [Longimicrobium sp.]
MMREPQQRPSTPTGRQDRDVEPCAGCGTTVLADPVDGGLQCARCGQWQALCDDCMPAVTEYARDAVWRCPECRERPLDS